MLVCGTSIFQPKRHDLVIESAPLYNESSLFHIFGSHLDLIVIGETIHEREDFVLCSIVNQDINMWEQKIVFQDRFIHVSVIYTCVHFAILLRYGHRVRNPLWIRSYG